MRTRSGEETEWGRWLHAVTRETSLRGIAAAAGVSHTTVRRWVNRGVPPERAWDLALRYHADPIELLVLYRRIAPDDVPKLNYEAIVRYVPSVVLTAEIHRRASTVMAKHPELSLQKVSVEERQG